MRLSYLSYVYLRTIRAILYSRVPNSRVLHSRTYISAKYL